MKSIAPSSFLILLIVTTPCAHGNTVMSNASFDDWTEGDTVSVSCPGADLSGFNLSTDVLSSQSQPANLRFASLRDADLSGADLTGADFTGANLTGANFAGATLTGAILTGAFSIVDTLLDESDAPAGARHSLREGIRDVPPGAVIRFDSALSGETIGLFGAELAISKDLCVDASALDGGLTVHGNNASRVFRITSADVMLKGFMVTGGDPGGSGGGGILNNGASLTLDGMTIAGNTTSINGGGIRLSLGGTTTLINTTVSGNSAATGGGIRVDQGTLILNHSTVSGNSADVGGGIYLNANTVTITENSVLAGNTAPGGSEDIRKISGGPLASGGGNLIGSNDSVSAQFPAGLPNGNGDQVGTPGSPLDARLAPLGNYVGCASTMPPLPCSPAIERAILQAGTPATDQLGNPRPLGPAPDVGAVEAVAIAGPAFAGADSDNDDIPDLLEGPGGPYPHLTIGLDDSHLDTDRDGSTDREEIGNMTDLFDPSDNFRIIDFDLAAGFHATTNPLVTVTMTSFPGLQYDFEASTLPGAFEPVPGSLITANAFTETIEVMLNPGSASVGRARSSPLPAGMVLVPAGNFAMGDDASGMPDETPGHAVNIRAFYLERFEVTKALWDEVRTWAAANGYPDLPAGAGEDATHPVHSVDWYAVVKWCNARSEKEGLTPVYYTDATRTAVYRTGDINLAENFVAWSADGFRLPTEAEWEKAARGSLAGTIYPWGDTIGGGDANYSSSGDPFEGAAVGTTPVGYYNGGQVPAGPDRANGYGLYDIGGNVWEWCWDRYDSAYYAVSPGNNPRGPVSSPFGARCIRGGSWFDNQSTLRNADRGRLDPTIEAFISGLRCARGL